MTPWLDDGDVRLYHGDALEVVREMADESLDTVVTSPPYWGLRDYGTDGQMGLEETPDLFVAGMVELFREIRRVLAPHGTCWVNVGDSYASQGGPGPAQTQNAGRSRTPGDLKPKDLVGIPWRVAFALQADGWYLRSDIVWSKPNPMPESVTDRPTKSHEYVFLLTKAPRYWFDKEAVREPAEWQRWGDQTNGKHEGSESAASWIGANKKVDLSGRPAPQDETLDGSQSRPSKGRSGVSRDDYEAVRPGGKLTRPRIPMRGREFNAAGRNFRSVWQIATQPYPEAHFATFPEELARRCTLAGCPIRVCRVCGKPSGRITSTEYVNPGNRRTNGPRSVENREKLTHGTVNSRGSRLEKRVTTDGWSDCGHNNWRPGTVLDPFIGSGTTAKVARDHQRHAIGIDLNEQYLQLAARRLQQLSLLTGDAA